MMAGTNLVTASRVVPTPLQRVCLRATEDVQNPRAREMSLRLALDWMQDALTGSK
jgi:hypothetical protein